MRRLLILALLALPASAQTPSSMVVTTRWLAARLGRPDIVVVQVARERQAYDAGHIPGARLLMLSDIAVTRGGVPNELAPVDQLKRAFEAAGVADGKRVVLYSEEANLFAARAWWTLDYLGHAADAALLDGSIDKWRAEQRAITMEVPAQSAGTLTPHVHASVLATIADVERVVKNAAADGTKLLDARPPEQFSGEIPGEDISRPGHIPGATNVYWVDLLESPDDPQLLPLPDLRKKFRLAALSGRRVIVYCRSGMQSSVDYFVARFLGYDVSMYDGSFWEWSNSSNNPVEKNPTAK